MKYLPVIVFLLSLLSCTERIDIRTEDSPPRLVIYGYITTDTTRHAVRISCSSGYFSTSAPEGISGATVSISNGRETFPLKENSLEPGLYETEADVYGVEGETYTLSVAVDFDGDGEPEAYEATSWLPYRASIDSMAVTASVISDDFLELRVWGRLADQEENWLSFHPFRNSDPLAANLEDFFIIDDEHIAREINGVTCWFFDQEEEEEVITPGDLITLYIHSLTKEYGTFLDNAQREFEGSDPIFSGPPANVETNLRATGTGNDTPLAGFFSAYSRCSEQMLYQGIAP